MTKEQVRALIDFADALLEAVTAMGDRGMPAGHLYAAVMGHMSLEQSQAIMRVLVKAGKVTHSGHVYRAVQS